MFGLMEELARAKVADHERLVARLQLERQALACQRDFEDAVRRAPRPRRDALLGGFRFSFRGR